MAEGYNMGPVDGVPLRTTTSNSYVFTPPLELHSSTSSPPIQTNGSFSAGALPEIPKRESIPSASDVPSQASPQPVPMQSNHPIPTMHLSLHSPPHSDWHSPPNGHGPGYEDKTSGQDYLHLYNLKQAQLETAERSHRDVLDELLKGREKASQLAEKMQDELRQEVRSVRKVEEALREKLEEQLRQERAIWNSERDMLLQKIRHLEEYDLTAQKLKMREQENESLALRNEQLKNRIKVCELRGCSVNGALSPGQLEDEYRLRNPSGRSFSPSGRSFSPSGRGSFSPSGRSFSPPAQRSFSPSGRAASTHFSPNGFPERGASPSRTFHASSNGSHVSNEPHVYFSSLRPNPGTADTEENPHEPPASVLPPLSPPPMSYRRHAGHTPGASMSIRHSPPETEMGAGSDTPTQQNFVSLNAAVTDGVPAAESAKEDVLRKANENHEADMEALVNGDVPLKGPLGLKPNPSDSTLVLEILNRKLGQVSENPDQPSHQPAVFLRGDDELSVISDSTVGRGDDRALAGEATSGNVEHSQHDPYDISPREMRGGSTEKKADDEPIPLRLKPSMNFGAPLGQVARRNDSASSTGST